MATQGTQTAAAPVRRTTKVKFERRLEQPRWLRYASPVILIIAALLVGAFLLQMIGANPWYVYGQMARSLLATCTAGPTPRSRRPR